MVLKVLVVCTGNICRSPYIEMRLREELMAQAGCAVSIASAGMAPLTGQGMHPSIEEALDVAGRLRTAHSAREATADLIAEHHVVITATRALRGEVCGMYPAALRRTFTFLDLADWSAWYNRSGSGDATTVYDVVAEARQHVPPLAQDAADIIDPFGRRAAVFVQMVDEVEAGLPHIVNMLARLSSQEVSQA